MFSDCDIAFAASLVHLAPLNPHPPDTGFKETTPESYFEDQLKRSLQGAQPNLAPDSCAPGFAPRLAPAVQIATQALVEEEAASPDSDSPRPANGYGSKLNHRGIAGFSPCFHLPGFHFGYPFLPHSQISAPKQTRRHAPPS